MHAEFGGEVGHGAFHVHGHSAVFEHVGEVFLGHVGVELLGEVLHGLHEALLGGEFLQAGSGGVLHHVDGVVAAGFPELLRVSSRFALDSLLTHRTGKWMLQVVTSYCPDVAHK